MQKNKLSVVIITYNEEANIEACIASVRGLADEILVVDSHSTDRTAEIAENIGATVLFHDFEGHIQQKNWAKSKALYDYVLSLDADERLSSELYQSILSEKEKGFPLNGYSFNRLNHLKQRPIKGCGWYPDRKLRLWNKNSGEWTGTNPHDRFELHEGCSETSLTGDLIHYTYPTYRSVFKQAVKFGKIGAKSVGATESTLKLLFKFLTSPHIKFIKNYILKGGFLYGFRGLYICLCQWLESLIKYSSALLFVLIEALSFIDIWG